MPVHKNPLTQQPSSAVVSTTSRVLESYSSMTSVKIVSQGRTSSSKLLESWSSPSVTLTSPQRWLSGTQTTFLPPAKSPSSEKHITRRSSIHVTQLAASKTKNLSSPRSKDFQVLNKSTASPKARRKNQSSAKSSVQRSSKKSVLGIKKKKSMSPKRRRSQLSPSEGNRSRLSSPSRRKVKTPLSTTHKRKRNAPDMEKEEASEMPAIKRRKQSGSKGSEVTPTRIRKEAKGSRKLSKTPGRTEKLSSSRSSSLPDRKRAIKSTTKRKTTKSKLSRKNRTSKPKQSKSRIPAPYRKVSRPKDATAEDDDEDDAKAVGSDLKLLSPVKMKTSIKTKKKAKDNISGVTLKRKSVHSSPKSAKHPSLSESNSVKKLASEISAKKLRLSTSPSEPLLSARSKNVNKTSSKKGKKTKKKDATPQSSDGSQRKSRKRSASRSASGVSRVKSQRGKSKEKSSNNANISFPKSEVLTPSKRKSQTPKSSVKSYTSASNTKANTPKSNPKRLSFAANSVDRTVTGSQGKQRQALTPQSGQKSKRRSQRNISSTRMTKSAPNSSKRPVKRSTMKKSGHNGTLKEFGQHLKISSLEASSPKLSEKVIPSHGKSAEDEKILEILRKAVKYTQKTQRMSMTTPTKSSKLPSSRPPKRLQSAQHHAVSKRDKRSELSATPRSAKLSQNASRSLSAKVTSSVRVPEILVIDKTSNSAVKTGTVGKSLLPPQNQYSRKPLRSKYMDIAFSRNPQGQLDNEQLHWQPSFTQRTLGRASQIISQRSEIYPQDQSLHESNLKQHSSGKTSQIISPRSGIYPQDQSLNESNLKQHISRKASQIISQRSGIYPQDQSVHESNLKQHTSEKAPQIISQRSGIYPQDQSLHESNLTQHTLGRASQIISPRSRDQSRHDEKIFSQFVERRGGTGIEKYGSRSLECTLGGQTYRAGSFHVQRERGPDKNLKEEEEDWDEDVDGSEEQEEDVTDSEEQEEDVHDSEEQEEDVNDSEEQEEDVHDSEEQEEDVNDSEEQEEDVNDSEEQEEDVHDREEQEEDVTDSEEDWEEDVKISALSASRDHNPTFSTSTDPSRCYIL